MDPTNPRILYAAFWDHQRQPWFVRSGGAGQQSSPECGLHELIRDRQTRGAVARPPLGHGGMTPEGTVYTLARQESLNGLHSIEFLVHLGLVTGDRLLVIWDGSPIHRRAEVTEFMSATRGKVRLSTWTRFP